MGEMIRAFIAIELSGELKKMLTRTGRDLATRIPPAAVRWVKPAAMHLTLQFLGDTPAATLDAITRAIEAATLGVPPITMTTGALGCFPNLRRPRVVWVGLVEPSGHLAQLKDALDRELEPLGFKPERRPFSPHLTLGRVHKRAGREDARRLGQVVESAELTDIGRMTADAIHLIRSDLRPSGPIYTVLARLPFKGVSQ
jgi:2'-5' RNA ligase